MILQAELRIKELPPLISEPSYQPALSPTIQKTNIEFPKIVNEIIKKNRLHVEEFNKLQDKMNGNILFRWRVINEIKLLERKYQKK